MSTETTLADELRQVARNLDRAAGISAQYCASRHHTAAIRRAADRLEELEKDLGHYRRLRDEKERELIELRALAPRPAATPDPDQHHVDEIRRIMAADWPGDHKGYTAHRCLYPDPPPKSAENDEAIRKIVEGDRPGGGS